MWFRKKQKPKHIPFPGVKQILDGHEALYLVARQACDSMVVRDTPDYRGLFDRINDQDAITTGHVSIRQTDQTEYLAAMTTGSSLLGQRTTAVTDSLGSLREALYNMAGKHLGCVINLTCRTVPRQAGALHGSHDDYHDVSGAGAFQLFASNVQEVADFNLIAHRIAETALVPGIVAQDYYRTSHAMQWVQLPEPELVNQFLGKAADTIETPTPAQQLLFGEDRRRMPVLLDQDHPAGIGVIQDHDSFFRSVAAQHPYFFDHLDTIIDDTLNDFGELTGRFYEPVSGYRTDDAEVLVIAQGAINEELQATVDLLREREKIKAGVIKLSMLRPFPGAQLTYLLKGKKAVTVLERCDQPLAEDLPLMREVRAAIDKAVENSLSDSKSIPFPDYQSYPVINVRPRLFSGCYGVGTELPTIYDLVAVYRNMLAGSQAKKNFYVGHTFTQPDRRFPNLQTLQQGLQHDYSGLDQWSVSGKSETTAQQDQIPNVDIHFLSSQGGLFAVNLFARAMADALDCEARTFPVGGLEQIMQPASCVLAYSREEKQIINKPVNKDMVLISAYNLVENHALLSTIREGGRLVISSTKRPEMLRTDLSRRIQQLIHSRSIQVHVIDAHKIATDTTGNPSYIDQLMVWALLGIYLETNTDFSEDDLTAILRRLQEQLAGQFKNELNRVEEITTVMKKAAAELIEIPAQFWQAGEFSDMTEPAPPWTIQEVAQTDNSVFDATRFWHSVGYLYDTGQPEEALVDPYLATAIVPAATSAFRDNTPYRLRFPDWLPENCTGCGTCWAVCPESALPPVVQGLPAMIQYQVTQCEARGIAMTQMKRVLDPLATQTYRLLQKDDLGQYQAMGPLLQDAFNQMAEKMKLEGDKLQQVRQEFDPLHSNLETYRIARTEKYFTRLHDREKNSGMLLGITLNPMTCTSCGICIESCPEMAFEWREQDAERVKVLHDNWRLQLALPDLTREQTSALINDAEPETSLNRLLKRSAYHSMVGGDGTASGNTAKTAVHLLTAATEAVMQLRFENHADRLEQLIDGLEKTIQGEVTGSLDINDFEEFTRRLSHLDGKELSPAQLAGLVRDKAEEQAIDQSVLKRQSELLNQLKRQLQRYREGAAGNGRARMLLVVDSGAVSSWSGTYPYNPYHQPWVCYQPGNATGLAEAITAVVRRSLMTDITLARRAELELDGAWDDDKHVPMFASLNWHDLEEQEQLLIPPVILICQASDVNEQDISAVLSGRLPVRVFMLNREQQTHYIYNMLHDRVPDTFIAQTSVGRPEHFVDAITGMLSHDGPALVHVHAPDPRTSGIAMEQGIEHAALAVQGRVFPLFTSRDDTSVNLAGNPDIYSDWTVRELTARDPDGKETVIASAVTFADWAIQQARYQRHFEIHPRGQLNEQMMPLKAYLALAPEQREDIEPYIDFINDKQQHFIAVASQAIIDACESTLKQWRSLQKLSAGTTAETKETEQPETVEQPAAEASPAPAQEILSAHQQLTQKLLQLCGYSQDPEFFNQSLGEFLTRDNPQQPEVNE